MATGMLWFGRIGLSLGTPGLCGRVCQLILAMTGLPISILAPRSHKVLRSVLQQPPIFKEYPGMEHSASLEELADISAFITSILGGSTSSAETSS